MWQTGETTEYRNFHLTEISSNSTTLVMTVEVVSTTPRVAVDEYGNQYIADWGNESVKVFDASGIILQEMRGEATLSKWASEFLETNKEEGLSRRSADLEALDSIPESKDPHTISAHIEKFFWSPVSVKLQGSDYLFMTESNRHRIQVYSLNSS